MTGRGRRQYTPEQMLAAHAEHGLIEGSRRLGCAPSTMQRYLRNASEAKQEEAAVSLPEFPDDDVSADEILDTLEKRYARRNEFEKARSWFRVRVKGDKPIGIAWVGDPHLGSNGCNIPLLRRDCKLIAESPGMFAVNMGDTVDNWGGKLLRLYAENDVSRQTERKLARWFLCDSGIKWLLWLFGNHEEMNAEFSTYLKTIGGSAVPMLDWSANFIVEFESGQEFRINAAHNHKGGTMWNNLHGQERAARLDEHADVYVAGDHHVWGIKQEELPGARVVTLLRARGYKFIDSYVRRHQFNPEENGATVVTILDPTQSSPVRRVRAFADVQEAVEYLAWLRK